jgi:hypothetical protein
MSVFILSAAALSGCTADQMSRNVYEGWKAYGESLRSTPLEKSKDELPGYDQYAKERRGGAAAPSVQPAKQQ